MQKIKDIFKKIINRDDFPFIVVVSIYAIINMLLPCVADDMVLRNQYKGLSIWAEKDLIIYDYLYWSSRVVVNCAIHLLLRVSQYIWAILNTILIYVFLRTLSKLLVPKDNKKVGNIIIACLFVIYPYYQLGSAGWVTTSVTYLWVVILGCIGLIPIRKVLDNEKFSKWEYFVYSFCLLFGANQEQMSIVILAIYCMFVIYFVIEKKITKYIIVQTFLSIGSLVFILTAPGNNARSGTETIRFLDYESLSLIKKVELGFSSAMNKMLTVPSISILFIILLIIMAYSISKKHKNIIYTVLGCFPPILFSVLYIISKKTNYGILVINNYGSINVDNHTSLIGYFNIFIMLFIIGLVLINIYVLFGNNIKTLFNQAIFLLGVLTKIALGFSPTVWASGDRTYIFMYFCIISIICNVYIDLYNREDENRKKILVLFLIISVINILILIKKSLLV